MPVERRRAFLLAGTFLIPLAVYLAGFRYVGSGDTRPAELLPISLLRQGNLDFDEFARPSEPLPYWFRKVDGHVVSNYPILPGLLNTPAFLVADLAGVDLEARDSQLSLISAATISALSVSFLFLCLDALGVGRYTAFAFAMIYAFGTCVWSVTSRGLWQHGPSLLFLTAALWMLARRTPRSVAWSGLLLGLAVVNRPTNALLAVPLAVVVLAEYRASFPAFLGLTAVPLALRAAYAWKYWGDPFSLGQANPIPNVANFGGNPFVGLAGLLVSPSRGLLVFSPIFLFVGYSVASLRRERPQRPLLIALAAGAVLLLVVTAKWTMWWGGHCFGYRLLIEILPPLMVLLTVAWVDRIRASRGLRVVFLCCLVWSVIVNGLGAWLQPSGFNERLDQDPGVLWSLRESEIAFSLQKLGSRLHLAP